MNSAHLPARMDMRLPGVDLMLSSLLEVRLNGIARNHVVAYDIEARTLTRYCTDERGGLVFDGDDIRTETLHGDVGVVLKGAV